MTVQITTEYLSKLLNLTLTEHTQISLSSAQKSRLHGWLTKNNITFSEATLTKKFTVIDLIELAGKSNDNLNIKVQKKTPTDDPISLKRSSIGIDLQQIDELFPNALPIDPKEDKGLTQIFTFKELSYAQSKNNPKQTLAGIFCAKEAILKISNRAQNLNEMEIMHDENGAPIFRGYAISISHSKLYAIAIAAPCEDMPKLAINIQPKLKDSLGIADSKEIQTQETSRLNINLRAIDYIYIITLILIGYLAVYKK